MQETQEILVPSQDRDDSPGGENGNPLQYFCLENSTEGRAWQAIVCGGAKTQTWLGTLHEDFWYLIATLFFYLCGGHRHRIQISGHRHGVDEREVAQSCPTLCDPVDCSLPGSTVHGIFQVRMLEWVAIPYSKLSHMRHQIMMMKALI